MGTNKAKVPVSERGLIARINRKLKAEGQVIKKPRSESLQRDLGDFYILDLLKHAVMEQDVDLEKKARELGVLAKWEYLAEEGS